MSTFKKNQNVICLLHGPGKVTNFLADGTVGVKFKNSTESYTPIGKLKCGGDISASVVLFDAKAKIVSVIQNASPKEILVTVEFKKAFKNFAGNSFVDYRDITCYMYLTQYEATEFVKKHPEAKIISSDVGRH